MDLKNKKIKERTVLKNSLKSKTKTKTKKKKKSSFVNLTLNFLLKNKHMKNFLSKESKNVVIKEYFFKSSKMTKDKKIVFLSDIHLEVLDNTKEIKEILENVNPDFIILGGDYIDNDENFIANKFLFLNFFNYLTSKAKTFAVAGNHDSLNILSFIENETDVNLLLHESISFDDFILHGVEDYVTFDNLSDDFDVDLSKYNLLISHTPNFTEKLRNKYDLILSGHTHGGQVTFFNFAPINNCIERTQIYGEWKYKDNIGITSSGIGCSGVAVRRGIKPEVVVLNIKRPY